MPGPWGRTAAAGRSSTPSRNASQPRLAMASRSALVPRAPLLADVPPHALRPGVADLDVQPVGAAISDHVCGWCQCTQPPPYSMSWPVQPARPRAAAEAVAGLQEQGVCGRPGLGLACRGDAGEAATNHDHVMHGGPSLTGAPWRVLPKVSPACGELTFTRRGVIRALDSYASLLVLLLANFFLLELVDDPALGRARKHAPVGDRPRRRDQRSCDRADDQAPARAVDRRLRRSPVVLIVGLRADHRRGLPAARVHCSSQRTLADTIW